MNPRSRLAVAVSAFFLLPLLVVEAQPLVDTNGRGIVVLSVDSELTLEGYLGTVPDALGFQDQYDRVDPVIDIALGLATPDGPAVWVRAEWVAEYYRSYTLNFPDPLPGNSTPFENNNISGYVFVPLGWGSASLGRQSVHFGEPWASSLMASNRIPFLDSFVFRVLMGRLSLTQVIATIENRRANPDISDADNPLLKFDQNTILYTARYLEWQLGSLRVALGMQAISARADNAFGLADLFPAASYAGLEPQNISVTIDASWRISPSLTIFTTFGVDDVNLDFLGTAGAGVPTAAAGIIAARFSPQSINLALTGEVGSTHYLWGSFPDDQDLIRAIWRRYADNVIRSMPLTSPYGPGASWASFDAVWSPVDRLELTAEATAVVWDPRADLYHGTFASLPEAPWPWPWNIRFETGLGYDFALGFSAYVSGGFEWENAGPDWFLEIGGAWEFHQEIDIPSHPGRLHSAAMTE